MLKYFVEFSFFLFSFFIAKDLVVLLITYENDGVFRVAELGGRYRLLLKSAGQHSRLYIFYPPRNEVTNRVSFFI